MNDNLKPNDTKEIEAEIIDPDEIEALDPVRTDEAAHRPREHAVGARPREDYVPLPEVHQHLLGDELREADLADLD